METYTSPNAFIEADKQEIIDTIKSTARFGLTYAEKKYNAIIRAAHDANEFGYIIDSNIKRIRLYISFIRKYDEEIAGIMDALHDLVDSNEDTDFVKQIHLIETFKGAGFLSAVSLMGEIGDFQHLQSQNNSLLTLVLIQLSNNLVNLKEPKYKCQKEVPLLLEE